LPKGWEPRTWSSLRIAVKLRSVPPTLSQKHAKGWGTHGRGELNRRQTWATPPIKSSIPILLLSIGMFGCRNRVNEMLVINEQSSVEQAVADCESRASAGIPRCLYAPADEIRRREAGITDAFRSDPACSGITLLTLNISSHASRVTSSDSWWLFLEPSRELGKETRWRVTHGDSPSAHYSLTGNSDAKQIAHDACRFIRGETGAP